MKKILHMAVVLMVLIHSVGPVLAQTKSGDQLWESLASGVANDLVLKNFASLAGSACDLYGLGIDLVNVLNDGEWSFVDSLIEMTALFRNQSWRELIWAMSDERERLVAELTKLKREQCIVRFASKQALSTDQADQNQMRNQLEQLEGQVIELESKMKYYAMQRRSMLIDKPVFMDMTKPEPEILPIDKVFYWLYDGFDMNWEQFSRDSVQFLKSSWIDLRVFVDNFPDTCFGALNAVHELLLYFVYATDYNESSFSLDGQNYQNFRDFVQRNAAVRASEYVDKYCERSAPRSVSPASQIGAEEQFQMLIANVGLIIESAARQLNQISTRVSELIQKKRSSQSFSDEEQEELVLLLKQRGLLLGMMEYHALIIRKVGSSTSKSLTNLGEKLSGFVEAVLGVVKDDEGKKKSRISFSERFQKQKKKQLQKICSRIAQMYSDSGRSTNDLPTIGVADGFTFCESQPDCQGVDLSNLVGGSEGRKKLADCSGFTFSGSELGPSQATKDLISIESEDIETILERSSYNDLLKARDLHFASLRGLYSQQYGTQSVSTSLLEKLLADISNDLYRDDQIYNPDGQEPKTHYSVLRKVYDEFWKFMDEQEGSCPAPENPID